MTSKYLIYDTTILYYYNISTILYGIAYGSVLEFKFFVYYTIIIYYIVILTNGVHEFTAK